MQYAELAAFFDRLEATPKRLEMTAILVEMLEAAGPEEFGTITYLVQGKVAPDWEGIELGLAEKLVLKALESATGHKDVVTVYHEAGDLGAAAQQLLAGAATQQATLFGSEAMSVQEAYQTLRNIAGAPDRTAQVKAQGRDSQQDKQRLLTRLLTDVEPLEAKFLIRTVAGRLRLGVADMTFLDALAAWHRGGGVKSVQEMEEDERAAHEDLRRRLERAFDVRSDLALVARTLALEGIAAVDALEVSLGTPLRPMAAERLKTLGEILEKHDRRSALEYKYDGLRIQAHVPGAEAEDQHVRLFSRRMEELTAQFPDVQQHLREALRGNDCIVEGECVAIDPKTGRMRPFQELSRRRGRKTGLGEDARSEQALSEGGAGSATMMEQIPVAVYLFDCLARDGENTLQDPYEKRRAHLDELFDSDHDRVHLSLMEVAQDEATMEAFFARAVADGAEGIMCKSLQAPYKAGNRGFDWIKYKTDYTEDLVDTMDLVVIGAFYGRGRRAGWYGALLMAAYDPDTDTFQSVCKLGTGFDDETLKGLKTRFVDLEAKERPAEVRSEMQPDVWLRPEVVMEVQAAELTLSPTHRAGWGVLRDGAGIAARFPRFSGRWRDDKGPGDATTVGELVQMYEGQESGA